MDTKYPTEGGSYIRQDDGSLKKIEGTEPAPAPVNRASPEDPHPEPPAAPASPAPQAPNLDEEH